METRFAILGPVEVETPSGAVTIRGARRRALLIRLLVSANKRVPMDRLADDIWEGRAGSGSLSTLASHMSLLRSLIGADRILNEAGCYRLTVNSGELDASKFEAATVAGQLALRRSEFDLAAEALSTGLNQWRGKALADVDGAPWARGEIARLDELRLGAEDSLLDARMALGHHRDIIAIAEAAVDDQPLREHRWATLMLALYRSGRQADALRAFQRLDGLLAEELGLEPSSQLIDLERAILAKSPDLDAIAVMTPAGGTTPPFLMAPGLGPGMTKSATVTLLATEWLNFEATTCGLAMERSDFFRAAHLRSLRKTVAQYGGSEIKSVGVGLMAHFPNSSAALMTAEVMQQQALQETVRTDQEIQLGIGISVGAVTWEGEDLFGYPTVEASRLCAYADGGQILATTLVRQMAGERSRLTFTDLGELELDGLPRPVATQLVEWRSAKADGLALDPPIAPGYP